MDEKERSKIQILFEKNADYFSKHNKHHSTFLEKLYDSYNKYFGEIVLEFSKNDLECELCQSTVIKLWSTIIYEVWERKII